MSWFDLVLVLVVATVTALGAQRRLAGLFVGLGGVLLLHPLLLLGRANPFLALIAALLAGLGLSLVGRRLVQHNRRGGAGLRFLGGVGGLALGLALMLSVVTSLPIQRNLAVTNGYFYPAHDLHLPSPLSAALRDSRLVRLGSDILFYAPARRPGADVTASERALSGLHRLFVVGQPWKQAL